MRPADPAPIFLFQVWHLIFAALGVVLVAAFALGVFPVPAALGGLALVVLVVLIGSRRARA
jgi:hypothetical protein